MLSLGQQRPRIRRELSRRIGYTNGLQDIYRFTRVVSYLHRIAPSSVASLRATILDRENIQGAKYADGVIDVAGALGLMDKIGTKLTLSDRGYALYAVQQMDNPTELARALLLHSVLESDGDATLNLLDILANHGAPELVGRTLVERLLQVIELREQWASQQMEYKLARDVVLQELSDSKKRLMSAVNPDRKQAQSWSSYRAERRLSAEKRIGRFYDHTVTPRRGWLQDLGCIEQQGRRQYEVTKNGYRLLALFRDASCYMGSVLILPLSTEVTGQLGVAGSGDSEDLFWRATASAFAEQTSIAHLSPTEHLHLIECIYPHVKLHVFNEATIESIYNVMAARLAVGGKYLGRRSFEEQVDSVSREFSDRVFRLRQRHGGSGYIALRAHSE